MAAFSSGYFFAKIVLFHELANRISTFGIFYGQFDIVQANLSTISFTVEMISFSLASLLASQRKRR